MIDCVHGRSKMLHKKSSHSCINIIKKMCDRCLCKWLIVCDIVHNVFDTSDNTNVYAYLGFYLQAVLLPVCINLSCCTQVLQHSFFLEPL